MRHASFCLSLLLAFVFARPALAQPQLLQVGDSAPELALSEFVKGDAFETFEQGKVYVVEFWATWCGPCRTTIPHLSEIQERYAEDVTVLGVAVSEPNPAAVRPFVENMGDSMDYAVALDKDDTMNRTWMQAAQQPGIPTAFIVDPKGRIAWIGHPMAMDGPLEAIVSGEFDIDALIAERDRIAIVQDKGEPIMAELRERFGAGDIEGSLEKIDELLRLDAGVYAELGVAKFQMIGMQLEDWDRAYTFAGELIKMEMGGNAEMLAAFAWYLLTDSSLTVRRPAVALSAAEKAVEMQGGTDADLLDTLALAHAENGDLLEAIKWQEKAVEFATDAQASLFETTLERYRTQFEESAG